MELTTNSGTELQLHMGMDQGSELDTGPFAINFIVKLQYLALINSAMQLQVSN